MKRSVGLPPEFPEAKAMLTEYRKAVIPDFTDTERTFRHLDDGELRRTALLFRLMGQSWLTNILAGVGVQAVKYGLPGAAWLVRKTAFTQFVGGVSLEDSLPVIRKLGERRVTSILDYGAEAKSTEADFEKFRSEVIRALKFSSEHPAAVAGVVKVTGLAHDDMLEQLNDSVPDLTGDLSNYPRLKKTLERLDHICGTALENNVQVYVDAEESWMQNTIDALADEMMRRYNKERVVVLNTFQLYRHDRLAFLRQSHRKARREGYLLGAKLVRGAYMVKENNRAAEGGYPTPIQPDLASTHRDYDLAVRYCIENSQDVACCVGSHNENSVLLTCNLMLQHGLATDSERVQFAQLYGMSDNLTFNLAEAGYNVSKYLVYGPVKEVLPYLVRRAQENTSVTGEMGRELKLLRSELSRRRQS